MSQRAGPVVVRRRRDAGRYRSAGCLAWRVACVEPGGVHQQRGADAAESSSQDAAGVAGLEAAVLELPGVSDRPPPAEVALRPARDAVAHPGLVGVVAVDAGAVTAATPASEPGRCRAAATKSVRAKGCGLRKSPSQEDACWESSLPRSPGHGFAPPSWAVREAGRLPAV